ncbi:unnamed protein product [Prunus armeniaca]
MLKPRRHPSMRLLLMRTSWDTRIAGIVLLLVALEHEDGKQLYLDLPPAQSEQSNVVDVEAVEEQIADEAAMEEDNSQGGVADKVRPYANEQAGEAVE